MLHGDLPNPLRVTARLEAADDAPKVENTSPPGAGSNCAGTVGLLGVGARLARLAVLTTAATAVALVLSLTGSLLTSFAAVSRGLGINGNVVTQIPASSALVTDFGECLSQASPDLL